MRRLELKNIEWLALKWPFLKENLVIDVVFRSRKRGTPNFNQTNRKKKLRKINLSVHLIYFHS